MSYTPEQLLTNLGKLSGEELYRRIRNKYGDIAGFSKVVNKALSSYSGPDVNKYRQIVSGIESKIGQYMLQQQKQKQAQQQANNISPEVNIPDNPLKPMVPHIRKIPKDANQNTIDAITRNNIENEAEARGYNKFLKDVGKVLKDVSTGFTNKLKEFQSKLNLNSGQITKLNNLQDILNKKIEINNAKLSTKVDLLDSTTKGLSKMINELGQKYGDTYNKIGERLNKYEAQVNDAFKEMRNNINKIGENYHKMLEFNQAAAGSAAEKQLRAGGGKGAMLRVANYLQSMKQAADKDSAILENKLLETKNQLEQNLLQMKHTIMADKNMNDKDKAAALGKIEEAYNNLMKWNYENKDKFVDETSKPYEDQLDYQRSKAEAIDKLDLQHKIQKLDYTWQNKPENRGIILQNIIDGLKGSVSDDALKKAKEAPDLATAINILKKGAEDRDTAQKLAIVNREFQQKMTMLNKQLEATKNISKQNDTSSNSTEQQTSGPKYDINDAYSDLRHLPPVKAIGQSIYRDVKGMFRKGDSLEDIKRVILEKSPVARKYPDIAKQAAINIYNSLNK